MLFINCVKPDILGAALIKSMREGGEPCQVPTGGKLHYCRRNLFHGLIEDVKEQILAKGTSHTSIHTLQLSRNQEESVFSVVKTPSLMLFQHV